MGIPWSAIMYPDNRVRREEVELLVQRIRNNVTDFHSQIRTLSSFLHRKVSAAQYPLLPPFDTTLTFAQNLHNVTALLQQWKEVVKGLEEDSTISQEVHNAVEKIKSTMQSAKELPDLGKLIEGDPILTSAEGDAASLVAGTIAGSWSSIFFEKRFSDLLKALSFSDVIGLGAGVLVGDLVNFVVATIEGYIKRNELENLKREYSSLATKLDKATDNNRVEVENIIYAITMLASITN